MQVGMGVEKKKKGRKEVAMSAKDRDRKGAAGIVFVID